MSVPRPLRDAALAMSLLTIVPTPARWPEDGDTQVAAWFTWVGGAIGLLGYGLVKLAGVTGVEERVPYLVAGLVVLAWAIVTRMLHWDGLADVADGYWGSHDVSRRLEIMSDSHTGAFGVTAVALAALLELAGVGAIVAVPHELPLLVVPVVARFSATAAAWLGTPARAGGLGRSIMGRPTTLSVLIALVPLMAAMVLLWLGFHVLGLGVGLAGLLLAFAVPHLLARRFGGVTGDVMGASVLITEVGLFILFALVVS